MIDMLERHEVHVLRRAGDTWKDIAALSGVSVRTVRRIAAETDITTIDNATARARRQVGRPSKANEYRDVLITALTEEPTLRSVELLHRARQAGYTGGKSAIYALAQTLRIKVVTPLVRFEGLPGEFSQHDFGEVRVRYQNGTEEIVHFFASRLKYSRWAEVTLVADEQVESLVRALVDHVASFGGIPLVAVFDRPKTVALKWGRDGSSPSGMRPLRAWRSISDSAWRSAGRTVRRRKGALRISWGGSRARFSSSGGFWIARIWRSSCGTGSSRPLRSVRRALPGCRRRSASPRSVPGCGR
jgi:transposase